MINNEHNFENTDALSYLSTINNGNVDLVITDPPYIVSKKSGFKSNGKKGVARLAQYSTDFGQWDNENTTDHQALMRACAKEWYRVLKKGGTLIVWYDLWKLQSMKEYLEEAGFKQLRFIEWVKTNPVPITSQFMSP